MTNLIEKLHLPERYQNGLADKDSFLRERIFHKFSFNPKLKKSTCSSSLQEFYELEKYRKDGIKIFTLQEIIEEAYRN